MTDPMRNSELFNCNESLAAPLLKSCIYPWEVLPKICQFILDLGPTLPEDQFDHPAEDIWIARDATVAPTASLTGPLIVDHGAQIKHCAYIRGSVLVGAGAEVGNSTEMKNCIIMNRAQAPHYNYIGDSIMGYCAHTGASALTSNLKSDKTNVSVRTEEGRVETGLRKFGAAIGDYVEVGCGSVLNPGTVIGKHTRIYPLSSVRGFVPADGIYKDGGVFVKQTVK